MMKKTLSDIRWSTIGRSVNLRVPTNLAIAVLTLATFILGMVTTVLMRKDPLFASVITSLAWAGVVFFSWALARELDPDR